MYAVCHRSWRRFTTGEVSPAPLNSRNCHAVRLGVTHYRFARRQTRASTEQYGAAARGGAGPPGYWRRRRRGVWANSGKSPIRSFAIQAYPDSAAQLQLRARFVALSLRSWSGVARRTAFARLDDAAVTAVADVAAAAAAALGI